MSAAETEARTKHTEGPWLVTKDGDHTVIHDDSFMGRHIAYMSNGGVPEVEEAANAALIASAPDLLDALRGLIDWVEIDNLPMDALAMQIARAAIAKAEGR